MNATDHLEVAAEHLVAVSQDDEPTGGQQEAAELLAELCFVLRESVEACQELGVIGGADDQEDEA